MQQLSAIVGHPLHIYLLTQDNNVVDSLQKLWPSDRITWTTFSSGRFALERILNEPPDMIIAEQFLPGINGINVLRMIKKENVYRRICTILMVRNQDIPALPGAGLDVDELIILPVSADELRMRVRLALHRSIMTLDANPLTRLPGNTSIINTVQRLISVGTDFSLAYADLDNFKPYNDKYGFSRGDEMLLMTARLIVNTVSAQQCEPSFAGHVGGDDFIFVLPSDIMETACKRLISDFDTIAPSFYDPEDQARGCILSHDRQGCELSFPILGISIAVVPNVKGKYQYYAELSSTAGQLKKIAKATQGSNYVVDGRK
jgi:GGDEF domain-containing protein